MTSRCYMKYISQRAVSQITLQDKEVIIEKLFTEQTKKSILVSSTKARKINYITLFSRFFSHLRLPNPFFQFRSFSKSLTED